MNPGNVVYAVCNLTYFWRYRDDGLTLRSFDVDVRGGTAALVIATSDDVMLVMCQEQSGAPVIGWKRSSFFEGPR